MEPWQKLLVAAGGAAGVSAVLCYLLREETESEAALLSRQGDDNLGDEPAGATNNDILQILKEMVAVQETTRTNTRAIAKEVSEQPNIPFDQLYQKVKEASPADPLEARGLAPSSFEGLLQGYLADPAVQADPSVQMTLAKLMGQVPQGLPSERAKGISADLLVEMHVFMLEELERFSAEVKCLENSASYDRKTVVMVSQVVMDGKRLAKFNVVSDDMDAAILMNQEKLSKDMAFMEVAMKFQKALQALAEG